ncbi:hypothetical protein [Sphingomonas yantingensis]|uniref:DUF2163 domain-containing protein n=1 Tax=Sphingomonas yantingensis TaxID=1241761 RepID=A0A7W9EGJ9_9SPHN|nr:hypothetical protein [Sphingomonas yantingensis]MBB5697004.1 hypothetical protein [Sphingomonas yantingensis]
MTFRLTPQMASALRAGTFPIAPLVEIKLPGYTLRHLVGAGEVAWFDGSTTRTFSGRDPRFGALVSTGDLRDGALDEAPDWDLTFAPPSEVAVEDLTLASAQGSEVSAFLGVVDRSTGMLIPEPLQLFAGELDVARLRIGKGSRTVEWRCVSALERFHDQERGARLSDAWHKLVWPGETGLANMSGIEKTSFWGVENPPSGVSYGGGGGGGARLSEGRFEREF